MEQWWSCCLQAGWLDLTRNMSYVGFKRKMQECMWFHSSFPASNSRWYSGSSQFDISLYVPFPFVITQVSIRRIDDHVDFLYSEYNLFELGGILGFWQRMVVQVRLWTRRVCRNSCMFSHSNQKLFKSLQNWRPQMFKEQDPEFFPIFQGRLNSYWFIKMHDTISWLSSFSFI